MLHISFYLNNKKKKEYKMIKTKVKLSIKKVKALSKASVQHNATVAVA